MGTITCNSCSKNQEWALAVEITVHVFMKVVVWGSSSLIQLSIFYEVSIGYSRVDLLKSGYDIAINKLNVKFSDISTPRGSTM